MTAPSESSSRSTAAPCPEASACASGAPESDTNSAPCAWNAWQAEAIRNSDTGRKPPLRRRVTSSVHPRTAPPAANTGSHEGTPGALHFHRPPEDVTSGPEIGQPRGDAVDATVAVDGQTHANGAVHRLVDAA